MLIEKDESSSLNDFINQILHSISNYLDMPIAFLTKLNGDIDYAYNTLEPNVLNKLKALPAEHSYSIRILDNRLPSLIDNATEHEQAKILPITKELGIVSHVSVPVVLSDGTVLGTLNAFSVSKIHRLHDRDRIFLNMMSDLLGGLILKHETLEKAYNIKARLINQLLTGMISAPVYQPIINMHTHKTVGFEALSRFGVADISVEQVFSYARDVGKTKKLELLMAKQALKNMCFLPEDIYMSINFSPESLCDPDIHNYLLNCPLDRIVIEVTEHTEVKDYSDLLAMNTQLQKKGARIAVDDVGSGFACFKHILGLKPDILKLDRSIVAYVSVDDNRRRLISGIVSFAKKLNLKIVAEGLENKHDKKVLLDLGCTLGQSFYLGRPQPIRQAIKKL